MFGLSQTLYHANFMHQILFVIFLVHFSVSFGCYKLYRQVRARDMWFEKNQVIWFGVNSSHKLDESQAKEVQQKFNTVRPRLTSQTNSNF